jgi:hypothetical protein
MLDTGLHLHSKQLDAVITSFKESNTFFSRATGAIESRTDTLCLFLEDMPDQMMAQQYKASSVWGTIAAIATQLDNKVTDLTKSEKLDQMLKILIKPIDKGQSKALFNDVGSVRVAIRHLVNEFQLNSSAESKRIDQMAAEVNILTDATTASGVTCGTNGVSRDQEGTSLIEGVSE